MAFGECPNLGKMKPSSPGKPHPDGDNPPPLAGYEDPWRGDGGIQIFLRNTYTQITPKNVIQRLLKIPSIKILSQRKELGKV